MMLTAISVSVRSQSVDYQQFYPYEIGNEWQYEETHQNGSNPEETRGYILMSVEADTLISGETWTLYTRTHLNMQQEVVSENRCAGRYSGEGDAVGWQKQNVRGSCWGSCVWATENVYPNRTVYGQTVDINGSPYSVEAVGSWGESGGCGPGGRGCTGYGGYYALGVGMTSCTYSNSGTGQGGGFQDHIRLRYAEVNGSTYGSIVVAEEPAPEAGALVLSIFPNPSARSASVRYVLTSPGEVRVTVHDLLGRGVAHLASGAHSAAEHTVTLPDLAPGTYAVRFLANGRVAMETFTVIR